MKLFSMPGIERRWTYDGPYNIPLVDMTIDDRDAYYRHYQGVLKLAFEDGAKEEVSMPVEDELTEEERETIVATILLPKLRAKSVVRSTPDDTASALVKNFLSYAKDRHHYKMYDDQGYTEPFEADAALLDWAINEWAAQRGRSSHNE